MKERDVLINESILSATVDSVAHDLFHGTRIPAAERLKAGRWIAARQGLEGAYAGTFAGFGAERTRGIVVFTGERIASASARHILGEESCRILRLLDVRDTGVRRALDRATEGLGRALERAWSDPRNGNPGRFCCGKCTVGLWRHLLAGGLDRREERLARGMGHLRAVRVPEGGWRAFPFWYTVLALAEADLPAARAELRHALPLLARTASRTARGTYAERRKVLAERVLSRIGS